MILRINIALLSKGVSLYEHVFAWKGKKNPDAIAGLLQVMAQFSSSMGGGQVLGAQFEKIDPHVLRSNHSTRKVGGGTATRRFNKVQKNLVLKMATHSVNDYCISLFYTRDKEQPTVLANAKTILTSFIEKYGSIIDENMTLIAKAELPESLTRSYQHFTNSVISTCAPKSKVTATGSSTSTSSSSG